MVGRRRALVIGNNYPDSNLQLKFAVADATKIKEVLENKNICGFEVDLLINETKDVVSTKLDTLFTNVHQDELIFIYFSGHGKRSSDNKDLYLFFKDTNETLYKSSALNFDFINDCLKSPSALKAFVIIVLDCCYSGAAGIRDVDLDVMEALEKPSGPGTVILTSTGSTGSPNAKEEEKLGHGVFTYYLIEGLEKGYADQDHNGYISIDELYEYASKKTKDNSSQSPAKKGSVEGNIFIGINPKIIKERKDKCELKKEKVIKNLSSQLPPIILSESLTILNKYYTTPSPLEQVDITILGYLKSLLQDDLLPEKRSDAIQNYIEVVQHLKGISINDRQKKWEEEEAEQKQEDRLEREKREKEEQERLRKQRDEELQRQREEEEKAEEKAIKEKEEQERLHQQQEEAEKLEESKRRAQEEIDKRKKEEEKKKQEEFQRKEAEQKREAERKRKALDAEDVVANKQGDFYTGQLTKLLKDRILKHANIFGLVLMVVLALVAAAYLGSYGDHATPVLGSYSDHATPVPLASFNANITSGHFPLDVQFTTHSENATLVHWDFGDGYTSIEQNPKHTYFTPGKYIVNLTASNENITNSTLTTISVRAKPFAYIFSSVWDGTVSVIDVATDNVVATIKVGLNHPEVVAVTPDGSKMYMAKYGNINEGHSSDISVIDTATNTITANVFVGSYPWGIAVTPDGTKVYLTNSNEDFNPFPNTVSVIDTATDTVVTRVNVGSEPLDVAVTPDGKKAYVTDWNNTVSVIDTSTNTITDTLNIDSATHQDLFGVEISPDGKKAYLINECGDTVSVIDTATNTITATVTAGRVLSGVITPDGTKVYVASYRDDNVSVIDTATNSVIATMNLGKGPYAIAVTPDGKKVYVVNRYSNNVSVIDTATNRVTATVSVGGEPCDVAIAPGGKKVYVPNYNNNTVSVIDTATDTVTTTVRVGQNPSASILR